ncbi:Hypothetical predicted protein, partial [Olea europaea subsp. europaea]
VLYSDAPQLLYPACNSSVPGDQIQLILFAVASRSSLQPATVTLNFSRPSFTPCPWTHITARLTAPVSTWAIITMAMDAHHTDDCSRSPHAHGHSLHRNGHITQLHPTHWDQLNVVLFTLGRASFEHITARLTAAPQCSPQLPSKVPPFTPCPWTSQDDVLLQCPRG